MLRILLADAALELVPAEVAGHPAVRRHARSMNRKPSQILMDQNLHGPAVHKLPDAARRGRPDIVHITLLALLESPLCKGGGLEAAVHTRDGHLMRVRSDTRLPRGESRFHGLIAKVLLEGASQNDAPLLWLEGTMEPQAALAAFASGPVVRLDEHGEAAAPAQVAERAEDMTLVLGAFPSGDWSPAWRAAAPEAAAIWPEALNAWAVAAECAAAHRARWGPPGPDDRAKRQQP